jgi:membrane-associated phospholipid phosphatase
VRTAAEPMAKRPPRWGELAWLAGGVSLLVLAAVPAAWSSAVPGPERWAFRLVNDTVTLPFGAVWAVMQLGNVVVIPVAAAVAVAFRKFWLTAGILVGGLVTYELARVVKQIVERGRPGALLPGVHLRDAPTAGLGYVSGHAAVVAFLATVTWPYLGRWARWGAGVLAALVCLSRVYVGAHLPLDIVGGAALGLAVGALVRLPLRSAGRRRSTRGTLQS